ncbi:MAG: isoprenylcysteine carboxylmethyltransferase family protein [Caldilineaceae bacterium]|nr:isoprenylcysteine carboxylmethyltransferase family protein [Caldilineaceae bacterium]
MSIQKYLYPPVYFLGGLGLIVLLHLFFPLGTIVPRYLSWLGAVLFVLGGVPAVLIFGQFQRAGTTIHPHAVSQKLVTDGLFRFSRNPIYAGMALSLLGAALYFGDLSPFVVAPLFVWVIQNQFIVPEERLLEETFGDAYREYKSHVRRWL